MHRTIFIIGVLFSSNIFSQSYLNICNDPSPKENSARTIKVLKNIVNDSTCNGSYKKLLKLQKIHLINRFLTDYTPLGSFSNLQELVIANNISSKHYCDQNFSKNIGDFSFLKKLTKLTTLKLNSLGIRDISFLGSLNSIRKLKIQCNNRVSA